MAINRILVAQDSEDNQILRTDNRKRFVINSCEEWQILFGPNSLLSNSTQVLKIAAEFDTGDFNSIKFAAHLFNPTSGGVDNAATCEFRIYAVSAPNWTETLIHTVSGVELSNSYFFADVGLADLSLANLDGDSTLMVEAIMTRLSETLRDRIYVNHLGVYDSIVRLRSDVEFLDITKLDE
jgi:hypothetical protein